MQATAKSSGSAPDANGPRCGDDQSHDQETALAATPRVEDDVVTATGDTVSKATSTSAAEDKPALNVGHDQRHVTRRLATEEAISEAEAGTWVAEMLKFLSAAAHARHGSLGFQLRPSPKVDMAWHAFILHTRDYADFCERELGFFLHHKPDAPGASGAGVQATLDYLRTRALVEQLFGPVDEAIWPV